MDDTTIQQHSASAESMLPWLSFSDRAVILMSWWKTSTVTGMIASMLIVALICILYEGVKALLRYFSDSKRRAYVTVIRASAPTVSRSESPGSPATDYSDTSPQRTLHLHVPTSSGTSAVLVAMKKRLRLLEFIMTALYGLQVLLSYVLMLCVMSFNGWILCSVIVGEAVGYYVFTVLGGGDGV